MQPFIPSIIGLGHLLVHLLCELTPTMLAFGGGGPRFREPSRVLVLLGLLLSGKEDKQGENK